MIDIVPKTGIGAAELKVLREISSLSVSEIKTASVEGSSIRTFEIFGSDWESQRMELIDIYNIYSIQDAPFSVVETEGAEKKLLSPSELKSKFEFWRGIELETQMNSDLEMGYIKDPSEFEPHDEDWA